MKDKIKDMKRKTFEDGLGDFIGGSQSQRILKGQEKSTTATFLAKFIQAGKNPLRTQGRIEIRNITHIFGDRSNFERKLRQTIHLDYPHFHISHLDKAMNCLLVIGDKPTQ